MWCPTRFCSWSFVIPNLCFHNSSDKFSFYLFADDTNLLSADKNLKCHEETVNGKLVKVLDRSIQIREHKMLKSQTLLSFVLTNVDHSVNTQVFDSSNLFFTSLE